MRKTNLMGKVFGRLTVISIVAERVGVDNRWLCQCVCGKKTIVITASLNRGMTKSCGCLKIVNDKKIKHGEGAKGHRTKEYRAWYHIKSRCLSESNNAYARYGGSGITICKRWVESYKNFLEDMGRAPSPKHSIHRVDNNGSYEPSNCKWMKSLYAEKMSLPKRPYDKHNKKKYPKEHNTWVSIRGRCNNSRNAKFSYYGGRGIKVCDRWMESFDNFLEDMGLAPSKKHSIDRINNDGNYDPANCRWATQKEQNNNKRNNKLLKVGDTVKSISEWAREKNINYGTLQGRISNNWPVDKLFIAPVRECWNQPIK